MPSRVRASRCGEVPLADEHRKLVALLREIRQGAGFTQVEVAERLGMPQPMVG